MNNSYKVRIEIQTIGTDFAELTVQAESPERARTLAGELYQSDDCPSLDYWASDEIDSSLDTDYQADWQVEKV